MSANAADFSTATMGAAAIDLDALDIDLPGSLPRRDGSPQLHAVERTAPARRPKMLYGLVAVAGALAIAGAQMGLSILTTQGSYEVKELTSQQRSVTWQKQILEDKVAGLSSPQYLGANAAKAGMVTGQAPTYLRLSDGKIIGSGAAATAASSTQAYKKAAVQNELVDRVPFATDRGASLGGAAAGADAQFVIDPAAPPAVADGLPTPTTH